MHSDKFLLCIFSNHANVIEKTEVSMQKFRFFDIAYMQLVFIDMNRPSFKRSTTHGI